ncbi:MAG: SGNH/GDSL hydrolase family protein [Acidobacteriota bacterium]
MTFWPDSSRATRNSALNDGRPALLFVGDSFTQGLGLSDPESVPWKVQQKFQEYDVRNLATGGYGTYQSLLSLKAYLKRTPGLRPKLVVYPFNEFHEARNVGELGWQIQLRVPPPETGFHFPFADIDSSGQLVALRSQGLIPSWPARHSRVLAFLNECYWFAGSLKRLSHKKKVTEQLLWQLDETVLAHRARLYVVFLRFEALHQTEYCRSLRTSQIRFVDCNIREQYDPKYQLEDGHPNALMNEKVADCVSRALREDFTAVSSVVN